MPQLRWTLLLLGVLFVILLWWLERRSQRQKFRERGPTDREPTVDSQSAAAPVFREPSLALPEMRAREPNAPHDLPVVEIEDDSLNARRVEVGEPLRNPPTLSLPVMESGPVRRERTEPSMSGTEWLKPAKEFEVPRLDTPAPKRPVNRIDLADTADSGPTNNDEHAFNHAVFGGAANLDLSEESTSPDVSASLREASSGAEPTWRDSSDLARGASEPTWRDSPDATRGAAEPTWRDSPDATRGAAEPTWRDSPDATRGAAEPTWRDSPDATRGAAEPTWRDSPDMAKGIDEPTWRESRDLARGPAEPTWRDSADATRGAAADSQWNLAPAEPISANPGAERAEAPADTPDVEQETAGPRFTPADVTPIAEPVVDWPPDDQRRVVALRLVAPPPDRLPGRALRLALASEGFVLGKFQIFHKPDASGRAVLSAANLSKPGTFDLGTMDVQRFGGLSLFAVLPGPKPPLKAFEDLLATARNLNERLQGALQDERGGPLTPTRIAALRESLSSTEAAS